MDRNKSTIRITGKGNKERLIPICNTDTRDALNSLISHSSINKTQIYLTVIRETLSFSAFFLNQPLLELPLSDKCLQLAFPYPDPKEGVPKFIHRLDEHAGLIREIRGPKGLPDMYFFRHTTATSGVKAGTRFGQKQFRMW